jgi:hypothetical protein
MATAERTFDDLIRTGIRRQVKDGDTLAKLLPIFRIMFSPLLALLAQEGVSQGLTQKASQRVKPYSLGPTLLERFIGP